MKLSGFGSLVLAITLMITGVATLQAQGTAFTYQGRLNNNGSPANGNYDFRFRLATDKDGNNYVGSTILTNSLAVSNGLFTATIDFGSGLFTGTNYWLQIDVRQTGGGGYTTLSPLQTVTPTPYSIFAANATTASQLTGAVGSASLAGTYSSAVTLNNPNNSFSGNGANVSNVDATALNGLVSSNFWRLGGNSVGSTNDFIGSTNKQAVVVKVNNQQAVRYETTTDTPNIVGGYSGNWIATNVPGGTIGGGGTVLGNQPNIITNGGDYGTIAGGYRNFISGYGGAVLGGSVNSVTNSFGAVGGGQWNVVGGAFSFIGCGYSNSISVDGGYSSIAGGYFNTNLGYASFIGGGNNNRIQYYSDHSTIGGGAFNDIAGALNPAYSTIGGGFQNVIQTNNGYGAISGGYKNLIGTNSSYTFIGGGYSNTVDAGSLYSTIGGGIDNHVGTNSFFATIGGGFLNSVGPNASYGTIPGGNQNHVTAPYGFAAGTGANAIHSGALVMTDGQLAPFNSITTNEFAIRAQNGLRVESDIGIRLNYGDHPIITRGWDVFTPDAPADKAGSGRWGLFMEPSVLTLGIPDLGGRGFQVAKYSTNGTYSSLMSVDQGGNVYANAFIGTNQSTGFSGTFSGNGGNLTNVNATTLSGLGVGNFALLNSSPSFTGDITTSGLIRTGSENGTADFPSPAGLVVRRINTLSTTSNSVVAVAKGTNGLAISLTRDGTGGGFLIKYPSNPGPITIACMGIDSTGSQKNFYSAITPSSAGFVQIYTNSQNMVHFECTFGVTFFAGQHLTKVTLSRYTGGFYWSGDVVSTVNQ